MTFLFVVGVLSFEWEWEMWELTYNETSVVRTVVGIYVYLESVFVCGHPSFPSLPWRR